MPKRRCGRLEYLNIIAYAVVYTEQSRVEYWVISCAICVGGPSDTGAEV